MESGERRTRWWSCMWGSAPGGGARGGGHGASAGLCEERRESVEKRRRRREEEKEKEWAWTKRLGPFIGSRWMAGIYSQGFNGQDLKWVNTFSENNFVKSENHFKTSQL